MVLNSGHGIMHHTKQVILAYRIAWLNILGKTVLQMENNCGMLISKLMIQVSIEVKIHIPNLLSRRSCCSKRHTEWATDVQKTGEHELFLILMAFSENPTKKKFSGVK